MLALHLGQHRTLPGCPARPVTHARGLTFLYHYVSALPHNTTLLGIQPGHPAHPQGAPVKARRKQLLPLVAVVEVRQYGFGARVCRPDKWHVQVLHLIVVVS
jgi:hypothetical protein